MSTDVMISVELLVPSDEIYFVKVVWKMSYRIKFYNFIIYILEMLLK